LYPFDFQSVPYIFCDGIAFFPEEKRKPYIPPPEDIDKVIALARPASQDYLWLLRDTMTRCGEINALRLKDYKWQTRYK
jgi:integrase